MLLSATVLQQDLQQMVDVAKECSVDSVVMCTSKDEIAKAMETGMKCDARPLASD